MTDDQAATTNGAGQPLPGPTAASEPASSASSPPPPPPPSTEDDPSIYESTHVHAVYEAIAPHFSSTRHKPWPLVSAFLHSLAPGSVGLDVGCGNGKYLPVNRDVWLLGSDRSANLVALARDNDGVVATGPSKKDRDRPGAKGQGKKGRGKRRQDDKVQGAQEEEPSQSPRRKPQHQVVVADSLSLPYRLSTFDFAISIAVLHHLSTRERRRDATRRILDCLRPGTLSKGIRGEGEGDGVEFVAGGKALLYVWALEQGTSRRGWDESAAQDQLVPWVTKAAKAAKAAKPANDSKKGAKPEAEKDAVEAKDAQEGKGKEGVKEIGSESSQDNKTAGEPATEEMTAGNEKKTSERVVESQQQQQQQQEQDATYHRYYHLYRQGELEEDVCAVGGVVLESGYERDNWWAICSSGPPGPAPTTRV